jgi:hypothetical protein
MGNPNFTSGVTFGLGGATATLVIDLVDPVEGLTPLRGALAHETVTLGGDGAGSGFGSVAVALPNEARDAGAEFFGRWYVEDPAAASGVAVSPVFSFVLFAEGNVTTCPLDLNGDRDVGGTELAGLLSAWGGCAGDCLFDMDASGGVDGVDLALLLARWGACP